MSVIEHDFPPGVPVTVVIDCSPPKSGELEAHDLALEAADLLKAGDFAAAKDKIAEVQDALSTATAERVNVRPLTTSELAQRDKDGREAAAAEATKAKGDADRQALASKFAAGNATSGEIQGALATLFGHTGSA